MLCKESCNSPLDTPWQRCNALCVENANTYQVLKSEAKRLRSLADRLDSFAAELSNVVASYGGQAGAGQTTPALKGFGAYDGLSQKNAVLKALQDGPQTTRELFERLNAGGQSFKKPVYVTAMLGRLKDKVERTEDGKKIRLKNGE